MKMPKLRTIDIIAVAALLGFIIIMAVPIYFPATDCQVARPGYKCETGLNVMIEHCEYWGEFNCDTAADNSLPQVEWYIGNLCELAKRDMPLDCSNLKLACNQATGKQTCAGV